MDEQERQEVADRAVAGEKVTAAKTQRAANIRSRTKRSTSDYNHGDPDAEDHETGAVPEVIPDGTQPQLLSLQIAANVAAIPGPLTSPEQIAARNATLLREESERINAYVARQREHQAAEARAAQEELKPAIERRRAGGG